MGILLFQRWSPFTGAETGITIVLLFTQLRKRSSVSRSNTFWLDQMPSLYVSMRFFFPLFPTRFTQFQRSKCHVFAHQD